MSVRQLLERKKILAPVLLLPVVLYIVAFIGFPFLMSFVYSLSNVTVGSHGFELVGLQNYIQVIHEPAFTKSLVNTCIITFVTMLLVIIFGHILAELLRQRLRFKWLIRFLVLLPWTAPIALGTIGFLWFFDSLYSPIDWVLRRLGLLGHPGALLGSWSNMFWLGRPHLALLSVITVQTWRLLPLAAVILLAGLNAIPNELIEAARVDGAKYFRRLFQIVLPLLFPVIGVTLLFGVFLTFTDMTVVWILTKGGPPPNSSQMLASLAFLVGIEGGDLAQGAAIALFFFPVLAGVAAIVLQLVRKAVVT